MSAPAPVHAPSAADGTGIRFPPPFLFFAGLIAGYLLHRAWPVDRLPASVAPAARVIGWILIAVWVVLAAWAITTFRRAGTNVNPTRPATTVVTTGPFGVSRNPMYLSLTCGYLGAVLAADVLWPLVFLPLVLVALHRLIIVREERYLDARFGDEYRRYRARVRRWL